MKAIVTSWIVDSKIEGDIINAFTINRFFMPHTSFYTFFFILIEIGDHNQKLLWPKQIFMKIFYNLHQILFSSTFPIRIHSKEQDRNLCHIPQMAIFYAQGLFGIDQIMMIIHMRNEYVYKYLYWNYFVFSIWNLMIWGVPITFSIVILIWK